MEKFIIKVIKVRENVQSIIGYIEELPIDEYGKDTPRLLVTPTIYDAKQFSTKRSAENIREVANRIILRSKINNVILQLTSIRISIEENVTYVK